MSNTIRQQSISLPQQPVPMSMIQQHLVSTNTRNPVKLIQTENGAQLVKQEVVIKQEEPNMQQSLQPILQNQIGKHQNILTKGSTTEQQHLVVQPSQTGGQQFLLQKYPNSQQQSLKHLPKFQTLIMIITLLSTFPGNSFPPAPESPLQLDLHKGTNKFSSS